MTSAAKTAISSAPYHSSVGTLNIGFCCTRFLDVPVKFTSVSSTNLAHERINCIVVHIFDVVFTFLHGYYWYLGAYEADGRGDAVERHIGHVRGVGIGRNLVFRANQHNDRETRAFFFFCFLTDGWKRLLQVTYASNTNTSRWQDTARTQKCS